VAVGGKVFAARAFVSPDLDEAKLKDEKESDVISFNFKLPILEKKKDEPKN